tara:strand:- start:820 stop:1005 length:186 start_codon:yes stop_codon:yes gene_type:complete
MNLEKYIKSNYQSYEDPAEYNETSRYCEICDIEENKTYFVNDTLICEDCHKEEEEETNENN